MQSMTNDVQAVNTVQESYEVPGFLNHPAIMAIANDMRAMRAMSGPPMLRQAAAGLIHLAFNTNENFWLQQSQAFNLAGQCATLRLCRFALGEIHKSINQAADTALKYHHREIKHIERATVTPDEVTASIYWEAVEKLDAAGIDFEQLLSYHYGSDDADADYDDASEIDPDDDFATEL